MRAEKYKRLSLTCARGFADDGTARARIFSKLHGRIDEASVRCLSMWACPRVCGSVDLWGWTPPECRKHLHRIPVGCLCALTLHRRP
jgi:hypothetical protein